MTDSHTSTVTWHAFVNAGVTYRQLHHWTTLGHLHRTPGPRGSGYRTTWPATEVPIATRMARLTAIGLALEPAEKAARGWPAAPGITITIDPNGATPR